MLKKKDMPSYKLSPDTDEDLEKVEGDQLKDLREAWAEGDTFLQKLGNTVTKTFWGRNTVGRAVGMALDVGLGFIPYGEKIQRIRRKGKALLGQSPERFSYQPQQKGTSMNWLKHRLRERTTWQGIIAVLTGVGVSLSPDQKDAIISAGMAFVTLIWVFKKEPQSEDSKK